MMHLAALFCLAGGAVALAPEIRSATSVASKTTFDYVIVGGGTAGLAIAARLTEDSAVTVAVIEAGIHHVDEPLVDTPEFFGRALANPDFDWSFFTVPQPALNNSMILQSRGKMLGGSSGLNFMAWDRGSKVEYDAWETLGNPKWNWDTLLPYFKKVETVSPPPPAGIFPGASAPKSWSTYHGTSGPVQPSYNVLYTNVTNPYVQSVNNLGIPTNSDPYTGDATGIYNSELSIDRTQGVRSYSANTYYKSSAGRSNLKVFTSTQATKILFAKSTTGGDLTATGVQVSGGTVLQAKKEVILSAGSLKTPQLLELSGIGNKTILKKFGITTLLDLPQVGENLQDHVLVSSDFELKPVFQTFDEANNNKTFLAQQTALYAKNHTGFLTQSNNALAFVPLSDYASPAAIKTIKSAASAVAASSNLTPLQKAQYKIQNDWIGTKDVGHAEFIMFPGGGLTAIPAAMNKSYITINSGIMHPFSRGFVHINSSDALVAPLINPRYLENDIDQESLVQGVQFARKITETKPLAPNVVGPHDPPASVKNDADFLTYAKKALTPIFHPIGTAAMAPRALGGVVDPELKVYGTSNVRVVDASVIPLLFASHIQSTVYAIAERGADIIKAAQ